MSVLLIGEKERRQIALAKHHAARRPTPFHPAWEMRFADQDTLKTKMLADRPANYDKSKLPPVWSVSIPVGYVARYSVEQQVAGLAHHLSIGVEGRMKKGMMPSPEAVKAIAEEFGIAFPPEAMWVEEFEPGEFAVNLVQYLAKPQDGSA